MGTRGRSSSGTSWSRIREPRTSGFLWHLPDPVREHRGADAAGHLRDAVLRYCATSTESARSTSRRSRSRRSSTTSLETNSKVVNSFRTRVWRQKTADHPAFGGVVYDSTEIQNYWRPRACRRATAGLLTALLGGKIGLNTGNDSIERHAKLISESFPEAGAEL